MSVKVMEKNIDVWESVKALAFAADREGLTEFEVHGIVRDAFREVQGWYMKRLDRWWDAEFERVRRARDGEAGVIHVQNIGGENMSGPVKEFASGAVRAAIFENERTSGDRKFTAYTVRVERR